MLGSLSTLMCRELGSRGTSRRMTAPNCGKNLCSPEVRHCQRGRPVVVRKEVGLHPSIKRSCTRSRWSRRRPRRASSRVVVAMVRIVAIEQQMDNSRGSTGHPYGVSAGSVHRAREGRARARAPMVAVTALAPAVIHNRLR